MLTGNSLRSNALFFTGLQYNLRVSMLIDQQPPETVTGLSDYISPAQVNILTPPDAIQGAVNVVLTNNGISSVAFSSPAQPISPSFFVFDAIHVIGVHLDGTDIGPTTLYPGLTTPAKPGETVVLFANGFGPTSTPVVSGSSVQSGALSPLPVIKIGGITANVLFAGLVAPGEFQFNVVVPTSLADGDQPITATYDGSTTQAGAVLTIEALRLQPLQKESSITMTTFGVDSLQGSFRLGSNS